MCLSDERVEPLNGKAEGQTALVSPKMPSFYSNIIIVLSVVFALSGVNAQCSDPARPLARCCMGVAAWSTNSVVWGGICGYTPPQSQ